MWSIRLLPRENIVILNHIKHVGLKNILFCFSVFNAKNVHKETQLKGHDFLSKNLYNSYKTKQL